jgi:ankyrin repeat protein
MHIGRSLFMPHMNATLYAIKNENREALDLLIDDFIVQQQHNGAQKKRVQIAENMFEKFSTGQFRLNRYQHHRFRINESRGAKEGNSALSKDQNTLKFCSKHFTKNDYFRNIFDFMLENGSSIELFDYLIAKLKTASSISIDLRVLYENVFKAVLNGHRKLAAHLIQNAVPAVHGFNALHSEVLKADMNEDLQCQLRANMCTKKPYSNDFITPIHCASINPNVKYLKTLLTMTQEFNLSDKHGRSPVHYAAVCEAPTPLEYLITRVSPYELDSLGNQPLHYACLSGRSINVEILLNFARKKCEDDTTQTTEMLIDNKYGLGGINKPNRRGMLPLHLAISRAQYDCIKVLLKYDLECNLEYALPASKDKITPLMYACQLGQFKIVRLLIDHNAKIEARDRYHRTALMHACMSGHVNIMSYLLRLGANPLNVDSSGNSCLHYAAAYGWYYAVKILLDASNENQSIMNLLNDWKLTAFGAAFLKGHVGICEQLLAASSATNGCKIDINFRTETGETLVMLCVSNVSLFNESNIEQLDYIVNKLNGNCQLCDAQGNNAFHHLAANKIDIGQLEEQLRDENKHENKKVSLTTEIHKFGPIFI